MAITRVTVTAATDWTGTSGATFASTAAVATTGTTLVVAVGAANFFGSYVVTGITDTGGNTYIKIDDVTTSDFYREELWYAKTITGHASNVVTVTWSGAVTYRGIVVVQYAGLDPTAPLDGTAKAVGSTAATVTTGTLTTTRADTVHVIIPRWGMYTVDTITWPAGFSANFSSDLNTQISETFVGAAYVGPYTITHTNTSTYKLALVAAFAAAAAPAAVETVQPYVWGPL